MNQLNENLENNLNEKMNWFKGFYDRTIITQEVLDKFLTYVDDTEYIYNLKRMNIPFEEISRNRSDFEAYNSVEKELAAKPHKKTWYIVNTNDFKRSLFNMNNDQLVEDLKDYYINLEAAMRRFVQGMPLTVSVQSIPQVPLPAAQDNRKKLRFMNRSSNVDFKPGEKVKVVKLDLDKPSDNNINNNNETASADPADDDNFDNINIIDQPYHFDLDEDQQKKMDELLRYINNGCIEAIDKLEHNIIQSLENGLSNLREDNDKNNKKLLENIGTLMKTLAKREVVPAEPAEPEPTTTPSNTFTEGNETIRDIVEKISTKQESNFTLMDREIKFQSGEIQKNVTSVREVVLKNNEKIIKISSDIDEVNKQVKTLENNPQLTYENIKKFIESENNTLVNNLDVMLKDLKSHMSNIILCKDGYISSKTFG